MSNIDVRGRTIGVLFAVVAVVMIVSKIGSYFALNKSDWAAWVQAIGSVAAILAAVWVSHDQHEKALQREEYKEQQEARNILLSLRDEIAVMAEGFSANVGTYLDDSKTGEVFGYDWHPADRPFVVYDACAGQIGKIANDELRRNVIRTYAQARGLLLSLKMNTLYLEKFSEWKLGLKNPDIGQVEFVTNNYRVSLIELGDKLRQQHTHAKAAVANLIADIDRHLATESEI